MSFADSVTFNLIAEIIIRFPIEKQKEMSAAFVKRTFFRHPPLELFWMWQVYANSTRRRDTSSNWSLVRSKIERLNILAQLDDE